MAEEKKTAVDGPTRAKGPFPMGNTLFVLLCSLDFPLQLYLLRCSSKTSGSSLFGLTPYYACIAAMVLTASARHVFWQLYISEQEMPSSFALMACTFNTAMNALNVGMSLWGLASNAPEAGKGMFWGPWARALGLAMFCLGNFVETFAELQRKTFKEQPANKGKVYMGGLFGMARHINFGGCLVWRTGFAIFGGGLPWGVVVVSYSVLLVIF
jgi:hypothetical protein